jgi:hypothetical protein
MAKEDYQRAIQAIDQLESVIMENPETLVYANMVAHDIYSAPQVMETNQQVGTILMAYGALILRLKEAEHRALKKGIVLDD